MRVLVSLVHGVALASLLSTAAAQAITSVTFAGPNELINNGPAGTYVVTITGNRSAQNWMHFSFRAWDDDPLFDDPLTDVIDIDPLTLVGRGVYTITRRFTLQCVNNEIVGPGGGSGESEAELYVRAQAFIFPAFPVIVESTRKSVRCIEDPCYLLIGTDPISLPLGPDPADVVLVAPLLAPLVTMTDVPPLPIPNRPELLGASLRFQVVINVPSWFPNDPLKTSNGIEAVIGDASYSYGTGSGLYLWSDTPPHLGQTYQLQWLVN